MTIKTKRVIVVGGGAAGMLAAISASRQGAGVTILERNPRVGKKLLTTGNGRCNFTNIYADSTRYYGANPDFVQTGLAKFSIQATIAFFEELGIAHKVEDGGKVFPMSDQASSVLDVLRHELDERAVTINCDAYVGEIRKQQGTFTITLESGATLQADSVILAAGGKAMPSTGSDGNGFLLAEKLGHTVINAFPGLVQLKLEGPFFKQIDGVKFVGTVEILHNGKSAAKDRGDILFGNYGVSGPPVLQVSRTAAQLFHEKKAVQLKITMLDTISPDNLKKLLAARFDRQSSKTIEFSLVGLINKRLIPVILKEAGIEEIKRPVASLSAREQEKIMGILTDWRFTVTGTKGWPCAQVTAGGVATDEINPYTMESNLVKGLFFAGEIMDIDGQCGGFNLQWAWSSGFIAGQNAALENN